jgi:hypothetical protein
MYLGGNGGMGLSMGRRIFSTSTDIAFPILLSLKLIEFSVRVYNDLQHFSSSFFHYKFLTILLTVGIPMQPV